MSPRSRPLPILRSDESGVRLTTPFPVTRADCLDGPRPCPHAQCRHYLSVSTRSCVLDLVSERGELTMEETAKEMGLSLRRIQQIEHAAIGKLRAVDHLRDLDTIRRLP